MTEDDLISVEATNKHNLCIAAVAKVLLANNMSFWDALAMLSNFFGQATAHTDADPTIAIRTIMKNFEAGYNSTPQQETMQ